MSWGGMKPSTVSVVQISCMGRRFGLDSLVASMKNCHIASWMVQSQCANQLWQCNCRHCTLLSVGFISNPLFNSCVSRVSFWLGNMIRCSGCAARNFVTIKYHDLPLSPLSFLLNHFHWWHFLWLLRSNCSRRCSHYCGLVCHFLALARNFE